MEAFSDGVLAIIITIMALEMKVPHGNTFDALKPVLPVFISYVLSFVHIGIYWNNHHHMIHAAHQINGTVLWANIHLLFWLSLIPFVTGWMGENNFTTIPVVLYGIVLIMASIAYYLLAHSLMNLHGKDSEFSKALGRDRKGKASTIIYATGIGLSFLHPLLGLALYYLVAIIWFIPDKRFENAPHNE
jgi:TMEM175 potassium channel family protein